MASTGILEDFFGFIFQDTREDKFLDQRFNFPDPYFMWKDEEKILPRTGLLSLESNTFRFLACCLVCEPLSVIQGN